MSRTIHKEAKTCPKCKEHKSVENYHQSKEKGLVSWCKTCVSIAGKERYGRLKDRWNKPLYKELRKVALAGRPRPTTCEVCFGSGPIHWDHCHYTGKFRGWLCYGCNHALGSAKDNPDTLLALAKYLDDFSRRSIQAEWLEYYQDLDPDGALRQPKRTKRKPAPRQRAATVKRVRKAKAK